ncbi:MAG: LytR/AlgR family response regulator transcription factor [Allosphingosinicella sp.]|uniref:LytR/AlgR family response regulator transcription factor n=1 Tax=Allosphingosinicella sp. TaxID=2823234 RepID=UPI003924684C
MRVLISEDEPLARALLRELLEEAGDVQVVGETVGGEETVAMTERLRPDAVFLDIDMPGGGGLGAACRLRSRLPVEIVFVTAHDRHAADAYDIGAIDYVLKPVRRPRLATAVERVRARLRERAAAERLAAEEEEQGGVFWVRTRQGKVRVRTCDIDWIEAARDHVYFHCGEKTYLHRITMGQLEALVAGTGLVRVQRSAFVRLSRVEALVKRGKSLFVELDNSTLVAVGPRYQERIAALLSSR